ncbi:sarcosine oxidase subunit gamma [Amycolatopsis sp. NPDC059027]|uniref:sarcosine oxidase subunit gamma n=1 Tax=Amycolatopsis sp. NPDC059027 TaxID=3346709 RepID=UPI00366AFF71
MTVETLRRSPLAEQATRLASLAPALRVAEEPFLTQLTVRVRDDAAVARLGAALGVALPTTPCTFSRGAGAVEICWMGPDEYLVLGTRPELEDVVRSALGDAPGAVVDVSGQRTLVTLSGPRVRDVLAHGCSVDLHPAVAGTGTCVQTLLARTGIVLLVRDAARDEFAVLVRSSFAAYFGEWLIDAAAEYVPSSGDQE